MTLFSSFPDADDAFELTMSDGAVLPVYRLAGPADAKPLLFAHANGMAAGSYAPWLKRLARHVSVFAFDARGHGDARWPEGPLETVFSVDRMVEDLAAVASAVAARSDFTPFPYVGHSLGGASALRLAAAGRAIHLAPLVIFEPPIFPPEGTPTRADALEKQARLIAGTLKRRTHWPSPKAFAERLKARGMFQRFAPAMLEAHVQATLRPALEGGYRLRCPPEIESFIFRSHAEAPSWEKLPPIQARIELIGGDPAVPDNDWISGALPAMAAAFPDGRLTQVSGAGHLLISEQPDECARFVLACLIHA